MQGRPKRSHLLHNQGHHTIINLSKLYGYQTDKEGICVGLSMTLILAYLSKDPLFFSAMQRIYQTPFDFLMQEIESLVEKSKFLERNENEVYDFFSTLLGLDREKTRSFDQESFDKCVSSRLEMKLKHIKEWHVKYDLSPLTAELACTILAILETTSLIQEDRYYTDYFKIKLYQPHFLRIENLIPLVQPNTLIPENLSGLYQKAGIQRVAMFSGCYSQYEIERIFHLLEGLFVKYKYSDRIALSFGNNNHNVMFGFDILTKKWLYGETHYLPFLKHTKSSSTLAKQLFSSFNEKAYSSFITKIYLPNHAEIHQFEKKLLRLQISEEWKNLHVVTSNKVLKDKAGGTWLDMAAESTDLEVIPSLLAFSNTRTACSVLLKYINYCNSEIMMLFLQKITNFDEYDDGGAVFVEQAVSNNDYTVLMELLKRNASSNNKDIYAYTLDKVCLNLNNIFEEFLGKKNTEEDSIEYIKSKIILAYRAYFIRNIHMRICLAECLEAIIIAKNEIKQKYFTKSQICFSLFSNKSFIPYYKLVKQFEKVVDDNALPENNFRSLRF